MSKEEVLKAAFIPRIDLVAGAYVKDGTPEAQWEEAIADEGFRPFIEAIYEAMDTYAASLLAEKEREWEWSKDMFTAVSIGQDKAIEILKFLCEMAYHAGYNHAIGHTQTTWSDFKEKHKI